LFRHQGELIHPELYQVSKLGTKHVVGEFLDEIEVCFNYLGQFDGLVGEGSAFGAAPEPVGAHCSPRGGRTHLIDVNALIVDGTLRCEWHHGTKIHRADTLRRLAEELLTQLRALMAATPAPGTGNRYDLAGASTADVDQAIEEIEFQSRFA
jgi:non-ribosomal peptide synthase protein (TIGR01720 family)